MKFLTVVVPVYNERKRLERIKKVYRYLKKQKYSSELIVVNDGSTDDTLEKLKQLRKKYPFKLISYIENKGRGYAVKNAFLKYKSKYNLFLDVDLSTPISEFKKFLPLLKNYDVMIASRKMKGSKLKIPQSKSRVYMGKMFTFLSRGVLRMNVSDFNCGFKCFSSKAVDKIFPKLTLNRWGMDCEALYIAKKKNLSIKEVPVVWINDRNTTVKFPRDIINSFTELLAIVKNDLSGKY